MNYYKIGDKKIQVPTSWKDVSYGQYVKLRSGNYEGDDNIMSILLGIEVEELRNIQIGEAYKLLVEDLKFANKDIDLDYVPPFRVKFEGKEYDIASNVGKETVGQFNDLKSIAVDSTYKNIALAFCIYLQPAIDGYYSITKVKELLDRVYKMDSQLVFCMGGFFFETSIGLKLGFMNSYRKASTRMKKWRQVLSHYRILLGSYLRFTT